MAIYDSINNEYIKSFKFVENSDYVVCGLCEVFVTENVTEGRLMLALIALIDLCQDHSVRSRLHQSSNGLTTPRSL